MERLERGGMQSRVWRHVPAFLEKWCVATDKGTFGAAERFYLELSEDNRRILVERAVSIYDGQASETGTET